MRFVDNSGDARSAKPLHQPMQLPQPSRVQHRHRALRSTDAEHVRRIRADRSWRAIRQLHHQHPHAVPSLKRPRRQQAPEQRMRLGDHPHIARQYSTQLLQSVAFTVGVGKTHVAQALGHHVARRGGDIRFVKCARMLADLAGGHADRTIGQRMREYTRPLVLIIDDFAMREHTTTQSDDLYDLVSDRAIAGKPLVLTSNRAPKDWYPLFPNPVVAESLLDRLINTSHQVLMDGPSFRPRKRPGRPHQVDTASAGR